MDQQDYDAACLLTYEMFEAKGFRDARDLASELLEKWGASICSRFGTCSAEQEP